MKRKLLGCVLVLAGLVVLTAAALVALDQWSQSQPPDGGGYTVWKSRDASVDAWRIMEKFVAARLKAPASATFPEVSYATDYRQYVTRQVGTQRYRITGWVDSQNSFSATIRTPFSGEVEQIADGEWQLRSLEFGP